MNVTTWKQQIRELCLSKLCSGRRGPNYSSILNNCKTRNTVPKTRQFLI
jgi:hypothetical protein